MPVEPLDVDIEHTYDDSELEPCDWYKIPFIRSRDDENGYDSDPTLLTADSFFIDMFRNFLRDDVDLINEETIELLEPYLKLENRDG